MPRKFHETTRCPECKANAMVREQGKRYYQCILCGKKMAVGYVIKKQSGDKE